MTWVGLRDQSMADYRPGGLGRAQLQNVDIESSLEQGSLLLEFVAVPSDHDQILLNYRSSSPTASRLQIRLDLEGVLSVRHHCDHQEVFHQLETGLVTRSDSVTVRYTWDEVKGTSALSMDVEETGETHFAAFDTAIPFTFRDAVRIFMDPKKSQLGIGVKFVAMADDVMPHGALPSLLPDTLVPTPYGKRPVSDLAVGDLIQTQDGKTAQIRWCGSLSLPAHSRFAPLRLCAPFHNATGDLICSYDQQIRLGGNVVEYLFATDQVSAKVGHMQYGVTGAYHRRPQTIQYAQFVLDRSAPFNVSGVHVEGMNIKGLLANESLRDFSMLASLPKELLPLHNALTPPLLLGYEAINLSKSQAA